MEADTAITHLPVTDCEFYRKHVTDRVEILHQCFSTFVRLRPGEVFFIRRGPRPNKFTRKYLSSFFKFVY